jgi:hypothetical protein
VEFFGIFLEFFCPKCAFSAGNMPGSSASAFCSFSDFSNRCLHFSAWMSVEIRVGMLNPRGIAALFSRGLACSWPHPLLVCF